MDTPELWVDAAFLQDDDYDEAVREAEATTGEGSYVQALAEYLMQWDYGDETDDAHTVTGPPWGSRDQTYMVTAGGLDYVLAINDGLRYASLNRRPLS